ncbi:erythromycin esterase family protein [Archangium primigenium]|uniref:erythromycin esterase family protein n=1 Tax=[Archangium] primigenium TaxID=2792470 RepID=UPI001959D42F|nr:erythromycin esterase family protein [Archangium primigenium]MBM7117291.1 erythromycin esterase family protein [Archangium primigenium]
MRASACVLLLALGLGCGSARVLPPARSTDADSPQLQGHVRAPDGSPLRGARVALVPFVPTWNLRTDAPVALVTTNAEGAFAFGPVPPGNYSLSAVTREGAIVFSPRLAVKAGEPPPRPELRLPEARDSWTVSVVDEADVPITSAALRVVRPGMPYDDVAFPGDSAPGLFRLETPPEEACGLIVSAPGFTTRMQQVARPDAPVVVRLERVADEAMQRAAVDWMKQRGVKLPSAEPGRGVEDLEPLRPVLQDARVVAMGEATHGTREFFQLKHRLFEFLVTRLGFTALVFESSFAEMLPLDEYVLTGKGDPAALLEGDTWDTEEVLALVRWMRRYNEDPAHPRKLRIWGMDMQYSPEAVARVLTYLEQVDPAQVPALREPFAPLTEPSARTFFRLPLERKEAVRDLLDTLSARFEREREAWSRRTRPEAWTLARQNLRVLRQYLAHVLHEAGGERDQAMADNVRWLLEWVPGTRMAVWSHNGHVMRGPSEWKDMPMGRHLARTLGPALYVFGFAFHQGAFQAFNMDPNPPPERRGMVEFSVPPSPEGSLDEVLARVGWPLLAVDLRALPRSGPAHEWWRRTHLTHDVGFVASDQGAPSLSSVRALESYDGLVFVERTTRARPNP